ncbi:oligosaccharide flippase family protein [Flavobacterium sp.]|uniref:oligosaccharide flippase family protein n=1 Tax=Flavobacterium sp. TaxID=239 RepID=UPI003526E160
MSQFSFHNILFKSTGLFGVSKLLTMAISVITNKVAAYFIGVEGIGKVGLLENTVNLIQSITTLGVTQSGVREIAVLNDAKKEQRLLQILYKWAWISGLAGVVICLLFANTMSQLVFKNENHKLVFLAFSVYFLFASVSSIRLAVLTGMRKVNSLVLYQLLFAIFSAISTIALYYFFKEQGIVPSFIITSFIGFLLSLYFTRNISITNTKLPNKEFVNALQPIIKLGLLLSVNAIFGQLCFYIIRWFLQNNSEEALGFYQVSNTFLVSYLGVVFITMSKDFYPRLTNYEKNTKEFNNLVNDQTEIALFIIVPAILALYLVLPTLIPILYSNTFLPVLNILHIGLFSVILKGVAWSIGYIALAKGNKSLFFKQNIIGDALNIIFSIILYHYLNLQGLGIAIALMFLISCAYTYWTVARTYQFRFRTDTKKVIAISFLFGSVAIAAVFYTGFSISNPILIITFIVAVFYSVYQLKQKL